MDIFFVLSGFLLTLQAWNNVSRSQSSDSSDFTRSFGERYSGYLRRRILRVFPAYYGCLTLLLLLAATRVYLTLPSPLDLVLHLGMAHNLIEKYIATMNGVFWTLPFEWQFYFAFPFMFILLRRNGPIALYSVALAVALTMKAAVMIMNNGYLQVLPLIRLDEFAAGICAATLSMRRPLGARTALAMCCVGIAGLISTPWVFAGHSNLGHYYDAVGFARPLWLEVAICLLLVGLSGARHRIVFVFDNRIIFTLGLISYSIYLFHVPTLELLPTLGLLPAGHRTLFQAVVTSFPLIVFVSALSYWFIERPFQLAGRAGASGPGVEQLTRLGPIKILVVWAMLLMLLLAVARLAPS